MSGFHGRPLEPMSRAVASFVAVPAFPVMLPVSVLLKVSLAEKVLLSASAPAYIFAFVA
jgi:hypothetical protein